MMVGPPKVLNFKAFEKKAFFSFFVRFTYSVEIGWLENERTVPMFPLFSNP
jgi:hypothetical protein